MAGSIRVDTEALNAAIAELQALSDSSELTDALKTVSATLPTQSTGGAATVTHTYQDRLTFVSTTLNTLFAQTVTILQNAEEYFTLTDKEVAAYIEEREV